VQTSREVMERIAAFAPEGSVVLLCRAFGDTVLCMHQTHAKGPQSVVSYERGKPMPLFRGATSRIILANQPLRRMRKFYDAHADALRDSGNGDDWESFRANMAKLRKAGHAVSFGEVDPGRIGIAAALMDETRAPLGSLSYVISADTDPASVPLLASVLTTAAREVEGKLRNG
jgi:DNA-binding IclR family transcriptional regulator